MSARVFVPGDSAALSVGADASPRVRAEARRAGRGRDRAHRLARPVLARAPGRGRDPARPRRLWAGAPGDARLAVRGRFPAAAPPQGARPGRRTSPICKSQQRLTFARCGVDRSAVARGLRAHGGLEGLRAGARAGPSRDRRRGRRLGPARPRRRGLPDRHQVADGRRRAADQKYVVCNADEGDSGTFADRMLMEGDPFLLIEGMAIAGLARRRDAGLHLHPLRISARHRDVLSAPSTRRARGRLARRDVLGSAEPSTRGAARRRRLHLRRGDLAARKPGGQARRRCAPSRRCRRSRACSASRRSSTTC